VWTSGTLTAQIAHTFLGIKRSITIPDRKLNTFQNSYHKDKGELTLGSTQIIGLVLLVLGAVLLFTGYQSTQAVDDQLHETFTGRFTDSTMFLLITGGISTLAGLGLLVFKR